MYASSCNGHPTGSRKRCGPTLVAAARCPEGHPVGDKVFIKHPYPNTLTYVFVFSGRTVCREHPDSRVLKVCLDLKCQLSETQYICVRKADFASD